MGGAERMNAGSLAALHKDLRRSAPDRVLVLVHLGTCGLASGAQEVLDALAGAAQEMGPAGVRIKTTGCAGFCSREPMITVVVAGTPPVKYGDLNPAKARRIYSEHVVGGKPVLEYALGVGSESTY